MGNDFIVKVDDNKETFPTGMQRSSQQGRPRPDLISPFFMRRLGTHMAGGASGGYGERNWELGQPISRAWASLCRHVEDFKAGDTEEDHLAAIAFGCMVIMHYQEMISRKRLPENFNDMPCYEPQDEAPVFV